MRVRKGELSDVGREYWIVYRWPAFSRRRLVWPLPAHLAREQVSLFISLPVCRRSSLLTGEGEEPNHMTARKPGPLYIIQYSLMLVIDCAVSGVGCRPLYPLLWPCSVPGWASSQLHCSTVILNFIPQSGIYKFSYWTREIHKGLRVSLFSQGEAQEAPPPPPPSLWSPWTPFKHHWKLLVHLLQ